MYASWWREDVLLRVANGAERCLNNGGLEKAKSGRGKPEFWVDVLGTV